MYEEAKRKEKKQSRTEEKNTFFRGEFQETGLRNGA